jgi:hypothetical protein
MKRGVLLAGAALALSSTIVLAQSRPESLLPPGVGTPTPTPVPTPAATQVPAPSEPQAPAAPQGGEVVQPVPTAPAPVDTSGVALSDIPSVTELEEMTVDELDDLLGLKPRYDIPPAARRSTERVGIIDASEGGLPVGSLARQPASIVRAALANTRQPLVSRWGHILLRRTLASRLAAPDGMDPVDFAALRAKTLNALGEHGVARALVQDIDTADYSSELTDAAFDAYVGTADIVGICPVVRLGESSRDDVQWSMLESICAAYAGETTAASNDLRRLLSRTTEDRIDVLLAQRFAGAAGQGRRAVTIEWDDIESMNPWRFALSNALGEPIPDGLSETLAPYYLKASATTPALPIAKRLRGASLAASSGILSAAAMVDLYSQLYANRQEEGEDSEAGISRATSLRNAYVDPDASVRLAAIREVWNGDDDYSGLILTAYAAARLTPSDEFAEDAGRLIASMLTAGLDRDAMRWSGVVEDSSLGWALLALANPDDVEVTDGQLDSFEGNDGSTGQRKSKMLLAGLAGLGRTDSDNIAEYSERLGVDMSAPTAWTRMIDKAADADNAALVAMLAGLGMQGTGWDQMTARHLYHIVSALNRVGLEAEARMIAAEAVARA